MKKKKSISPSSLVLLRPNKLHERRGDHRLPANHRRPPGGNGGIPCTELGLAHREAVQRGSGWGKDRPERRGWCLGFQDQQWSQRGRWRGGRAPIGSQLMPHRGGVAPPCRRRRRRRSSFPPSASSSLSASLSKSLGHIRPLPVCDGPFKTPKPFALYGSGRKTICLHAPAVVAHLRIKFWVSTANCPPPLVVEADSRVKKSGRTSLKSTRNI
jgi:hypothetical protein